jgi:SAM-dependent methyltransferase
MHVAGRAGLRVVGLFYLGDNVEDPFTGRRFRSFLPYGRVKAVRRKNALSPDSLSLERHRMMLIYLERETNFFDQKLDVLHVAPEFCFVEKFRDLPNLEYVTGDLGSPWAEHELDVTRLPFDDATFDVVFCNHVFEHVDDDRQAMREVLRVMRPGGWSILQVPQDLRMATTDEDPTVTDPRERQRRFQQKDHLRLYGRDYPERLREVGFEVEERWLGRELEAAVVQRYALLADEPLYIGRKPVAAA